MVYIIMTRLVDCFRTGDMRLVTIEHVPREDVRALTIVAPNRANIRRKVSAQETRRKKRQKHGSARSIFEDNTDVNAVPPIRTRTRACRLCPQGGHGKFKCPLVLEYGKPLGDQDTAARKQLQYGLTIETAFETTLLHEAPEALYDKLPHSGVGTVVLCERMCYENKRYVKVTVLDGTGNIMPVHDGTMISVEGVSTFVGKSKSNLVVNQMQCPLPHSQLNMSQLAMGQLSQGLTHQHNPFDNVGYGVNNLDF
jgi:hypothetical protein